MEVEKTNYLLNSIQKDNNIINKIYLYAKDLEEPKYQFLIDKREKAGLENLSDKTVFIEYRATIWMMFMTTLMITTKRAKEKF